MLKPNSAWYIFGLPVTSVILCIQMLSILKTNGVTNLHDFTDVIVSIYHQYTYGVLKYVTYRMPVDFSPGESDSIWLTGIFFLYLLVLAYKRDDHRSIILISVGFPVMVSIYAREEDSSSKFGSALEGMSSLGWAALCFHIIAFFIAQLFLVSPEQREFQKKFISTLLGSILLVFLTYGAGFLEIL